MWKREYRVCFGIPNNFVNELNKWADEGFSPIGSMTVEQSGTTYMFFQLLIRTLEIK